MMVGTLRAFLGLVQETVPSIYHAFKPIMRGESSDDGEIESVYDSIPSADFSRLVLSAGSSSLAVLNLGDVGWSDLGDPQRLIETLSTHGIRNSWRQIWVQEMGIAPISSR